MQRRRRLRHAFAVLRLRDRHLESGSRAPRCANRRMERKGMRDLGPASTLRHLSDASSSGVRSRRMRARRRGRTLSMTRARRRELGLCTETP